MSRQRTPEEKAARSAHARVTVWRKAHEVHATGEHVVVDWWDRIYHGHITELGRDGFRVFNYEGDGAWCSWEGATKIEEPWWDVRAAMDNPYPEPCAGCAAFFRKRDECPAGGPHTLAPDGDHCSECGAPRPKPEPREP